MEEAEKSPMVEDIHRQAYALVDEHRRPARAVMDPETLMRLKHEAPVHAWTFGNTYEETKIFGLTVVVDASRSGVTVEAD